MSDCKQCGGTGETGTFGIYDCAAPGCTAAQERYAFDMAIAEFEAQHGRMHPHDARWFAYRMGKEAARNELKQPQEKQG